MNKFAEQFQNDVVARYQQKMAELVKRAEDEQVPDLISQTVEEQNAKPIPTQLKNVSPEEAAKALDFEKNFFIPAVAANEGTKGVYPQSFDLSGEVPTNLMGDTLNASAVLGSGAPDLRSYSKNKFLWTPIGQMYSRPLHTQLKELMSDDASVEDQLRAHRIQNELDTINKQRDIPWAKLLFGIGPDSRDIHTPEGYPAFNMQDLDEYYTKSPRSIRNTPTTKYMRGKGAYNNSTYPQSNPINMDEIIRKAHGF